MKNYITAESFGADIPENWEEIAQQLNAIIDERGIADDQEAVNELWDKYWSNGCTVKSWYIVDDCTKSKGQIFTEKVKGNREAAIARARAEWEELSKHDQGLREAFYVGYAAEDEDGCMILDSMTDIVEVK